jgi:thymidylate synthase
MWYLSGTDDTTLLQQYAPQYKRFTEDGIHAFGAYGYRWAADLPFRVAFAMAFAPDLVNLDRPWPSGKSIGPRSQLEVLMLLLKEKPETRQAVLAQWNGGDLVCAVEGNKRDLPCTLNLSFIVRGGKLNMIATMRSNDLWLGTPNDVFCFTMIQQVVANNLGLELGWYQHNVTSLHYYLRNEEKLKQAASVGAFGIEQLLTTCNGSRLNDFLEDMLTQERHNRNHEIAGPECFGIQDNTLPGLLILMAATRWAKNREDLLKRFDSKVLRKFIEEFHPC